MEQSRARRGGAAEAGRSRLGRSEAGRSEAGRGRMRLGVSGTGRRTVVRPRHELTFSTASEPQTTVLEICSES